MGCRNVVLTCSVFFIVVGVFVVLGGVTLASYRGNDKLLLPSIIVIVVGVVIVAMSCVVCNYVRFQTTMGPYGTAESQPLIITQTPNGQPHHPAGYEAVPVNQKYPTL